MTKWHHLWSVIITIQREVTSTFDRSRNIKTYFGQFGKVFWIWNMKCNGNKWRAMPLRRETRVHKYKMETHLLCLSKVGKYTGVPAGHSLSTGPRIMGLFKQEAGRVDAYTERAAKQSTVVLHWSGPPCVQSDNVEKIKSVSVISEMKNRDFGDNSMKNSCRVTIVDETSQKQ